MGVLHKLSHQHSVLNIMFQHISTVIAFFKTVIMASLIMNICLWDSPILHCEKENHISSKKLIKGAICGIFTHQHVINMASVCHINCDKIM